MKKDTSVYHSPLDGRYASKEMNELFSDDRKFSTWRRLWLTLAQVEQNLGLDISDDQLDEMSNYLDDINYDVANEREKVVRHDVMAHVYAFGQQAKSAAGIIHLGATSCYVTDNADIIIQKQALLLIRGKLLGLIQNLMDIATQYKDLPTLGYTHYQPATPVTVGKRAGMWAQNFYENLVEIDFVLSRMKMLGCRGATGTSETFMKLFNGDEEKCRQLDYQIAEMFGFMSGDDQSPKQYHVWPLSGQTYPRNADYQLLNVLSAIAASAAKMANDIRLLQHDGEIEEPFGKNQIGSSAMAYKRNPMRCERICSLANYVGKLPATAWQTASTQWLERTLDDSAGRRIYIPDAFRAVDAILIICQNVTNNLVVNKGIIKKRLGAKVPFMATEDVIMKAVEKGADRQVMHAKMRDISMTLTERIKMDGISDEQVSALFLDYIDCDPDIPLTYKEAESLFNPQRLIGRCPGQIDDYSKEIMTPLLKEEEDNIIRDSVVSV